MPWTCPACTFHNQNDALSRCEICETKRVGETKSIMHRKTVQSTLFGGVALKVEKARKRTKVTTDTLQNKQENTSSTAVWLPSPLVSREPVEILQQRAATLQTSLFGIERLRNLQPTAVECALRRQSQIVVMATGGGKSLCYQLPAVTLGGTTVVVSPLIALMVDQVAALHAKGIPAEVISSSKTESQNMKIMERLLGRPLGTNKRPKETLTPIALIYVTPEQVRSEKFRGLLLELYQKQKLAGFAIDEAHCVSSWGHDFRPAYRELAWVRQRFPDIPCMACTATATPAVLKDIRQVLLLEDRPCHVGSFDRRNIFYEVQYKDTLDALTTSGAMGHLCDFIKRQHKQSSPCNGIVYVHKRDDTLTLARRIRQEAGIEARPYHGGMKDIERSQVQEDWMSGRVPIAIATIAFGMGIDLPHVRYVVHWTMAKTVEGFYQESGRAGRDGFPSHSVLYFSREDANRFQFLVENQKSKTDNRQKKQRALDSLEQVVNYCTKPACRRCFLLQHFGETKVNPTIICQRSCDFCQDPEKVRRAIEATESDNHTIFNVTRSAKDRMWDGQWGKAHGDDEHSFEEAGFASDWDVDGLTIRGSAPEAENIDGLVKIRGLNMPKTAFQRASAILSKYEAAEAKAKKTMLPTHRKINNKVIIPGHIKTGDFKSASSLVQKCTTTTRTPQKTSADLRAEIEAMKKQLEVVKEQTIETEFAALPTTLPVPTLTFSETKNRKR